MKNRLVFIFILSYYFGFSQIYPGGNIKVFSGGSELQNAWAGGMDLPQFSSVDITYDGKKDLIVFDKKGNKWLVFINEGNGVFSYQPQYEKLYPEITNLGLIRDYNCDNYGDIFAHTNQGIQVYKNTNQGGNPSFVLAKSILKYEASWGSTNIYKFNNDIPAIADFDGDGDIDILSFDLLGTTIPYYRNLSVENGYDCDSLIFEENTVCWGHFKESNSDNSVQLDYFCKGNSNNSAYSSTGTNEMHTGSTLAILDEDEDGDMDLLLGDVAYNNLLFLKNGGTNLVADMVSVEDDFPSYNTPIDVPLFPASFYVDINDDGNKDLLVSPNSYTSAVNKNCVWYYKNTGNTNERFSLQNKNFLVNTMIDHGSYSSPVFFDHNADGLLDMIVSNGYIYNENGGSNASMFYYENTGTATDPAFTLKATDYAGVDNLGLEFMKPTFGDLDGDGDQDMIFGATNGKIHYFKNNAGAGNIANISFSEFNYFGISVGGFSTPQLVDLNEDGLLDLIIGRKAPKGNVAFYKNIGTVDSAIFHKDTVNAILGGIHVENPGFLFGYSTPFVAPVDANGNRYIYVGSELGFIHKYKINPDSLEYGSFEEVDDAILEVRAGKRTSVSVVDINNDGKNDFFIGTARGGIHFYSDTLLDTTKVLPIYNIEQQKIEFALFPNPSNKFINIAIENLTKENVIFQFINSLGKVVKKGSFKKENIQVNIENLSKGIYFVQLKKGNQFAFKKLIVK